jgi:hypothetical protein
MRKQANEHGASMPTRTKKKSIENANVAEQKNKTVERNDEKRRAIIDVTSAREH